MSLAEVPGLLVRLADIEPQTSVLEEIQTKISKLQFSAEILPLVPSIREFIESPTPEKELQLFQRLNAIVPSVETGTLVLQVSGFYGPLKSVNTFAIYLTQNANILPGMKVTGLPGIAGKVQVLKYTSNIYGDVVINQGPPAITFPYVSYAEAITDVPQIISGPSSLLTINFLTVSEQVTAANISIVSPYNPLIYDPMDIKGAEIPLEDLGSNVSTSEGVNEHKVFKDLGAGTGALTALAARGPQDSYIFSTDSKFIPNIRQHTNFAQFHRVTPLLGTQFVGKQVSVEIKPREFGDILTNAYLALTLPSIAQAGWTNPIGRAIFEKVELMIENEVIEKITDDWYILHDQLFLDADEKLAMQKAINGGYPEGDDVPGTQPLDLMIPLEFFFTRRHSHNSKMPQRLEVPGFPLCALMLQRVYIRFTFRPQIWFTNYSAQIEFINPRLITEEIILSHEERVYYQNVPFQLVVNNVQNESIKEFVDGKPTQNFTANYPVISMSWFIRNKLYEDITSSNYFGSRYAYGYTSQYFEAGVPLTFYDGSTTRYIDTIDFCNIYINNRNILGTFATGSYFTYQQPMNHGLSIPTKTIYTYCFGLTPKEFNQGGYLDFKKVNSQTSKIQIQFLPQYAPDIAENYSIILYYYGYKVLEFKGGYGTLKN